ncbi:MAG: NAD-dependent epimerase/dehydratase family protein [Acidobacteria bacterium]|nr:NAD-dependent epimerase/dehydratase family protein [Acidobacteriota bacterium]NIM61478.1 NAD-dependent epimerase/dehydratase family protein [Acidobacteriota bacterium]NIO58110.1 NAD-dependent epimerase/dehydratase family protein [Acidobacteriota bacterium]NIQ29122.1 NAD-dependent epimerase/dehydratase family protein [Acidobacteriota bacterium]NIQ83673.1 NAD-dependent epimerase/dehydratase family protein [Acidobacteriota bacterium]
MASGGPILVTGGAGFIGSHTVDRLLAAGRQVVALDNFDDFYDPRIKRSNVATALENPAYRLVEGDIRDSELLDRLFGEHGFSAVIHLAARAGVRPSIEAPVLYSSVNLDGTTRMLEACRKHGVDRFVFGSSSSVYGNNEKVPFSETDPVDHPISPYAATKKAGEVLCHAHHHLFGIRMACLRFFTVYGPRQRPEMAIHKFAAKMVRGEEIEQYGDGSSARDYTFISDIVAGVLRALDRADGFHVWNLGGSRTIQLGDLIRTIGRAFDVRPKVRRLPDQPGDVDRTWADTSRAKSELGWEASVTLDRGLQEFREWFETRRPLESGKKR